MTIGGFPSSRIFCAWVYEESVHSTLHKACNGRKWRLALLITSIFHLSHTPGAFLFLFTCSRNFLDYHNHKWNFDITSPWRSLFIRDVDDIKRLQIHSRYSSPCNTLWLKLRRANLLRFPVIFRRAWETIFFIELFSSGDLDGNRISRLAYAKPLQSRKEFT